MRNTRTGLSTLAAAAAILAAGSLAPTICPPDPTVDKHRPKKAKASHKQNARKQRKVRK